MDGYSFLYTFAMNLVLLVDCQETDDHNVTNWVIISCCNLKASVTIQFANKFSPLNPETSYDHQDQVSLFLTNTNRIFL